MEQKTPFDFATALKAYVVALQDKVDQHQKDNFPSLPRTLITIETGVKYVRVVRNDNGQGGSVHSFINTVNGDILKAAGWKAPAKHARGSIYAPDHGMSAVTVYGANYL